jgi:hypothetical protein
VCLQAVLAELLRDLPTKVPQQRLPATETELRQRCTEFLGTGLLIVQQRCAACKSEDRTKLAEAERAAFAAFRTEIESRVSSGCTDEWAALRACQVGAGSVSYSGDTVSHVRCFGGPALCGFSNIPSTVRCRGPCTMHFE